MFCVPLRKKRQNRYSLFLYRDYRFWLDFSGICVQVSFLFGSSVKTPKEMRAGWLPFIHFLRRHINTWCCVGFRWVAFDSVVAYFGRRQASVNRTFVSRLERPQQSNYEGVCARGESRRMVVVELLIRNYWAIFAVVIE